VKSVAIIGGGFCGTLTAVNLARLSNDSLRVHIVNKQYPLGRGVAFGTPRPEHLLNVVARNMSAFPDVPLHFVEWLRNRADFADIPLGDLREQFVPRRVFGDYLQDLLFWHAQPLAGPGRVQIHTVEDEVLDVAPAGRGAEVVLSCGGTVQADRVVLATGNLAPHELLSRSLVHDHPAYVANPWCGWFEKLPNTHEDILLVGTGLTMIDVFLTIRSVGWCGTIYALSRTGLLPLPHFKGTDYSLFPPDDVESLGLSRLVTLMEEHCARLRADGRNPAVVVDKLRPFTQRIWRNFSVAERLEFSRRFRTRWNVVRHRIPPAVAAQIEASQNEKTLRILKGRVQEIRGDGDRIRALVDPGDGLPSHELVVGMLVNCTGPRDSVNDAPETLFRNLMGRGLIRPDELDMGIEVTPDFAVVDKEGRASDFLFAIGPLLKGTLWETTAVPELRSQAFQIAKALITHEERHEPHWVQETPENLVEYYI
jgi:uncharacterized NAD(P)/FAD-binding protein YdhS